MTKTIIHYKIYIMDKKVEKTKEKKNDKSQRGYKNLIKSLTFYKGQTGKFAIFTVLSIVTALLSILYPIFQEKIYNAVYESAYSDFVKYFALFFGLGLVIQIINFIKQPIVSKASNNVWQNMSMQAFQRIFPMSSFKLDNENTGKLYNRVVRDPNSLSGLYATIMSYIGGIIANLGYIFIIYTYSWKLSLYLTIGNIVTYLIGDWRLKIRQKYRKELHKLGDERSGISKEALNGIKDIKVLDMQKPIEKKFAKPLKEEVDLNVRMSYKLTALNVLSSAFTVVFYVGFALIAVELMKIGELIPSTLIVLYSYSNTIRIFVNDIITLKDYAKEKDLVAGRVMEVFDETFYPQDKFGTKALENAQGHLVVENLKFGYKQDEILFDDLSVTFDSNKLTAIVGKSGEGKSTIANLLFHLYDWEEGTIKLDGIDIRELDQDSLKNNLSIIPQAPYVFNLSIKENLLLANENATDEDILQALEDAQLKDYIDNLKDGINTLVGENGIQMSGGQKQRLAIARALLKKSKVIIFDEATSSLDNESQSKIQKVMENLKDKHTLIVIAHRLSTIKNADKIVVLNDHRVEDEGTHEQLMESCNTYKELYAEENDI